ncbi:hypothetical protein [Halalkalibacter sp. APA_J-10(15)]|uniref:hypothetical protein n=1 Tax=unclassified Halalkalibacter TaxID=2893063 RepID=UPI001FF58E64|nr:hypothetical protein [Halalkalibacter sp. APA_J-10(15)]MCK0472674.1 hypothetical protein [Halalkalibacter sp. APA_J-10(15)]
MSTNQMKRKWMIQAGIWLNAVGWAFILIEEMPTWLSNVGIPFAVGGCSLLLLSNLFRRERASN